VCFLWAKGLNAKDMHKEIFPVYGGKCLLCKAVRNWVEKFSQGHSKFADDAGLGHPVEIVTEVNVQDMEELMRTDKRIMIDSITTALGCAHGLAYSIVHDRLKRGTASSCQTPFSWNSPGGNSRTTVGTS
jgi:hypothetical protein